MDIEARSTAQKGDPPRGVLRWTDKQGNRLHIQVHQNPAGIWQIIAGAGITRPENSLTVFKDPPLGVGRYQFGYFPTRYLDATSKVWAATVAYVLEQQNAHHLIEDDARDQAAREAKKRAADRAAKADRIRAALQAQADHHRADGGPHPAAAFEALISTLNDEDLITLQFALANP